MSRVQDNITILLNKDDVKILNRIKDVVGDERDYTEILKSAVKFYGNAVIAVDRGATVTFNYPPKTITVLPSDDAGAPDHLNYL